MNERLGVRSINHKNKFGIFKKIQMFMKIIVHLIEAGSHVTHQEQVGMSESIYTAKVPLSLHMVTVKVHWMGNRVTVLLDIW